MQAAIIYLDDGEVSATLDLGPGEVGVVTFVADDDDKPATSRPVGLRAVDVLVTRSAAPVYYSTDGSDPAIGGPRCYVVPITLSVDGAREPATYRPTVIKIVSAEAAQVVVQAAR